MDDDYVARERALTMAQDDWHKTQIAEHQVLGKAREYFAFLNGDKQEDAPEALQRDRKAA